MSADPAPKAWDFEYAWRINYQASERWALALEGFGTINRLGNSGRKSEAVELFGDQDQHRLGPVAYYMFKHARGARMASLKDPNGNGDAAAGNAGDKGNGDDDDDSDGGLRRAVRAERGHLRRGPEVEPGGGVLTCY